MKQRLLRAPWVRRTLAPMRELRPSWTRKNLRKDASAGVVLGVESVPDGLASALLAGVNPVSGLYAYLFGMVGAAMFTSATFMAVQATGAMAIVVADVDLASREDPARSLFTLSVVTGIVMILAGALRLGRALRFVSNSVMTGFITAVGVNIVLGQLSTLTAHDAPGDNRVEQAFGLLLTIWQIDLPSTVVGVTTIALIVVLQRTRLKALGLVVAIIVGSVVAAVFNAFDASVDVVSDIADVPNALPMPTVPAFGEMPGMIIPALSLAFVGLVQGAAISAGIPNPDGSFSDQSQDFVGQGAGNVVAGVFQGMPVGGSMSASSLAVAAGARTRWALLFAGAVMAIVIVLLGDVVGYVAMPALAGLLIVVGIGTIKVNKVLTVGRTGMVQLTIMVTTFILTMLIPLQYAVLVGVGLSVILFVFRQSSRLVTKQVVFSADGRRRETTPPATVPAEDVVVLQPYGSLFFATASTLEKQMPTVTPDSRGSVVILRLRGADDAGATLIDTLKRYAAALKAAGSKLVIVTDNPRILRQMHVTGLDDVMGPENLYLGNEWVGQTLRHAHDDATTWVRHRRIAEEADDER